eukprot:tig00000113_g5599.t1
MSGDERESSSHCSWRNYSLGVSDGVKAVVSRSIAGEGQAPAPPRILGFESLVVGTCSVDELQCTCPRGRGAFAHLMGELMSSARIPSAVSMEQLAILYLKRPGVFAEIGNDGGAYRVLRSEPGVGAERELYFYLMAREDEPGDLLADPRFEPAARMLQADLKCERAASLAAAGAGAGGQSKMDSKSGADLDLETKAIALQLKYLAGLTLTPPICMQLI